MMKYTCVDCFSGAGGLSLGLMWAGIELLYSFDNDPKCIETQRLNANYFSSHKIEQANINSLLHGALLNKLNIRPGDLFLLAGGPPCQGFSIQRIGNDDDERNNLVFSYLRLIEEMKPQYFLMENVPGITGKRGRIILKQALDRAAKIGYWIHQKVLDAQDYGVPQRRKRVIVLGEKSNGDLPTFAFPAAITPEGKRITVRMTIGDLPVPPDTGKDHPDISHHRKDKLSETNVRRLLALKQGQGRQHLPEELLTNCHRIDASIIGHRNVYGRMSWEEVSPTITARFDSFTRGQFGHPEQLRSISLREGAMLQTFPKDFLFSGGKVDIARQIGNAVPPILAKAIGVQLIKCFEEKTEGTCHPKTSNL